MAEWVPVARLIVTGANELKGSALRWPLFVGAGVEAEEMMVVAPIKADYSEARW